MKIDFYISDSIYLITFAGTPPATQLSGISLVTAALAAITTLFPIFTPGSICSFKREAEEVKNRKNKNKIKCPC